MTSFSSNTILSDTSLKIRARARSPLLWMLIPLIIGYLLASLFHHVAFYKGLFYGLFLLIALGVYLRKKLFFLKTILLFIGVIIFFSYYQFRMPARVKPDFLPREAILGIQIDHIYTQKELKRVVYAIGHIVQAEPRFEYLIKEKLYLRLENKLEGPIVNSQIIEAKGVLVPIKTVEETQFTRQLQLSGIELQFSKGLILKELEPASSFNRFFQKQNAFLENILFSGAGEGERSSSLAVYAAMLLGNKAYLTFEQKQLYQLSGTLHLFAISGLHVGVIAACLAWILNFMRLPKIHGAWIGLTCLLYYVLATGASPSAMRAFLMVLIYWGSQLFVRKASPLSALVASCLWALLWEPVQLWNIGLQLSYLVVASILLYGLPLCELLVKRYGKNIVNHYVSSVFVWVTTLLGISLAANLASSPLTLQYFHIITPGSIPCSIVFMPMASLAIIGGCLSLLMGVLHLAIIVKWINIGVLFLISSMELVIPYMLKIKGLFFIVENPYFWISAVFLLLVFIWALIGHSMRWLSKISFYGLPLIVFMVFCITQICLI